MKWKHRRIGFFTVLTFNVGTLLITGSIFTDLLWQMAAYFGVTLYYIFWVTKFNEWIDKLEKLYGPTSL